MYNMQACTASRFENAGKYASASFACAAESTTFVVFFLFSLCLIAALIGGLLSVAIISRSICLRAMDIRVLLAVVILLAAVILVPQLNPRLKR